MGVDLGGIEFYAGPPVLGGPDDLDAVIREFIDGATTRLLVAVQELDSRLIAESILAAKARRVRTRIVLEGDYLREEKPVADPWLAAGENEGNRVIHSALLRAGIDLITDLNPNIFHQKFIVRDPGKPTAAVLTGSTNFTHTDTGTNPPEVLDKPGNNLNHVVVLHGRSAAELYLAEFERLRTGTFGDLHERHEPKPREFRLGGIRVKPVFAPEQGPEMEIMKQMLKATERVDFAMFTFAQSSGIDDTMAWMLKAGIPVRGVLDRGQGSQKWAATEPLKRAGARLYENTPGNGVRKLHHKLMVIDRRLTIVGSFNYTAPAATLNDENIVVLGDLEEKDPDAIAAQQRLAGYALAEIDRIVTELSRPV
ncbi:phospholipase D-like domain-containing protein [Actinoplanes regularis]|uniref:phospholipase D n=1 Tax=Actinoplanes regularis TaxID=52697 RepID=A0A238W3M5_9ACTN|nr:phospholipase D-like domain-containing protein [Actinoplanes regularis]GIE85292.1 phospholipase [Actinoplanes regularis]SNR41098.1 Phosphatidylserine/phosphatidylglycerophosphate/cardiolipin synthase [Actinoplanes regularis]